MRRFAHRYPPISLSTVVRGGVIGLVCWLILVASPFLWQEHWISYPAFAGIITLTTLLLLNVLFYTHRYRVRQMLDQRHVHCGRCRYPLLRADKLVRCPECGTAYDIPRLASYWKHCSEKKVDDVQVVVFIVVAATAGAVLTFGVVVGALIWLGQEGIDAIIPGKFVIVPSWLLSSFIAYHAWIECAARKVSNGACAASGTAVTELPHWERDVIIPSREAWARRESEGEDQKNQSETDNIDQSHPSTHKDAR